MSRTILEVRNLVRSFAPPRRLFGPSRDEGRIDAVQGVSFYMKENETLGLVGESGCGKTTTGKMILRLLQPDSGQVIFNDTDITALSSREFRPWRSRMQMIFQDLDAALNPGMRIDAQLHEAVRLHERGMDSRSVRQRTEELLDLVRLGSAVSGKYPKELSGGEKRRVGIARVLALRPQLLIADEPVSALDVSIQAQITNLLTDLQRQLGLSCLFISHDLPLVELVSHKVAVMYRGRIVETGLAETISGSSSHPYTRALWSSVAEKRNVSLINVEPDMSGSAGVRTGGCAFAAVCSRYRDQGRPAECTSGEPPSLQERGRGHYVACHFPLS